MTLLLWANITTFVTYIRAKQTQIGPQINTDLNPDFNLCDLWLFIPHAIPEGMDCPWNWLGLARGSPQTSSRINWQIAIPGRRVKAALPKLMISSANGPSHPA